MASDDWEVLRNEQIAVYNKINLNAVTSATDGDSVDIMLADKINVFTIVTGNTGAVTVRIEGSPTGEFTGEEVILFTNTYTATNQNDSQGIVDIFPYMRTTTTTQTNSTVTTYIYGRT